jgi:hypothetical protein
MLKNEQISHYLCTAYCFHVADGPAAEAFLIKRLARLTPLPQGEAI